jgi:hypothetical protein
MEMFLFRMYLKLEFFYIRVLYRTIHYLMRRIVSISNQELYMGCTIGEEITVSNEEFDMTEEEDLGNGNIGALVKVTPKSDSNYNMEGIVLDEDDYLVKVELKNGDVSTYHFANLEIIEDA